MSLELIYDRNLNARAAMSLHMPLLRALASQCESAVEFGVNHGCSTSALLMGCRKVQSFDIKRTKQVAELEKVAPHWRFYEEDSLTCVCASHPGMILFDSLHTFDQLAGELNRHAGKAERFLVFHDTVTFGEHGCLDNSGKPDPHVPGIRAAIDAFQATHPEWRTMLHVVDSHGLLVLRRGA